MPTLIEIDEAPRRVRAACPRFHDASSFPVRQILSLMIRHDARRAMRFLMSDAPPEDPALIFR